MLHLVLTGAWATVGSVVTFLARDSVTWVSFMSLYANFVGHWSAYQAARAEKKAGR